MFYYYSGEKPENPCEKCKFKKDCAKNRLTCTRESHYHGQQSILSKLVEVNLDEILKKYDAYRHEFTGTYDEWVEKGMPIPMTFEQFIQQQIQEGRDGKQ